MIVLRWYAAFECEKRASVLHVAPLNPYPQPVQILGADTHKIPVVPVFNAGIQQFIPLIWKYTNIQELTPYILNELIEKIVVHEKEIGADGVKTQQVDIYYKFIGLINQKAEGGCKGEVVKVKRTEIENQPA